MFCHDAVFSVTRLWVDYKQDMDKVWKKQERRYREAKYNIIVT